MQKKVNKSESYNKHLKEAVLTLEKLSMESNNILSGLKMLKK